MKAIILAAGRGSRMNKLTKDCPKCLVQLNGKTLLSWQLEALHLAGIKDIAIVTGYKREQLLSRGLIEFHNIRWSETDIVSSLSCADSWLRAGPCIVSYSDIFYSASAVRSLLNCDSSLAITYDPNWLELWTRRFNNPLSDAETFRLTSDGQFLEEIGNKVGSVEDVQGQYMGLLRFTPDAWAEVTRILSYSSSHQRDRFNMTGMLQKVIEAKRLPIKAIPYNDKWGEVDSAFDLSVYTVNE